jgi:tRNA(fMet)-specific endonuclease VapC
VYILDTNTVIYYFKRMGQVVDNFEKIQNRELVLPTLALYELQTGIQKVGEPRKRVLELRQFLSLVRVLDFDEEAANAAAVIRAYLEARGLSIGPIDMLIAGVALSQNAALVTHNTREFARIPNLQLVDWF